MVLYVRNFVYNEVRWIVERNHCKWMRWLHWTEMGIFAYYLFRMCNIIYMLNNPKYELWKYDYLAMFYKNHSKIYDTTFCLAMIMFDVMMIASKRLLYFGNLQRITWAIYYQLVVVNSDIYRQCRLSKTNFQKLLQQQKQHLMNQWGTGTANLSSPIKRIVCHSYAKWQLVHSLNHLDKGAFNMTYLKLFPNLSIRNRHNVKSILDTFNTLTILQHCIAPLFYFFYTEVASLVRPTLRPLVLAEFVILCNQVICTIQLITLLSCLAVITVVAFVGHMREVNRMFHHQPRLVFSLTHWPRFTQFNLRYFYREHTTFCRYILCIHSDIWSGVLLVFLLNNIPINIFFMSRLLLNSAHQTGFEKWAMWAIFTVQLATTAFVLLPWAFLSKEMHRSAECMPTLQYLFRRDKLSFKFMFDSLYARLVSGKKYGIGVGFTETTITFSAIVEIAAIYSGVFLIILKSQIHFSSV